jgi:hypothetical protein
MENGMPELITVAEFQKIIRRGRNVAYSIVHRKDFPSLKIGGQYFVIKSKLPEWIEKQSEK